MNCFLVATQGGYDLETYEWMRVAAAVTGAFSIFLGYRLFCDSSLHKSRSGLFTNLASGALLALFGLGILLADVRVFQTGATVSHPSWQKKSTSEGVFGTPSLKRRAIAPTRLV
jgi:hypothetical protein